MCLAPVVYYFCCCCCFCDDDDDDDEGGDDNKKCKNIIIIAAATTRTLRNHVSGQILSFDFLLGNYLIILMKILMDISICNWLCSIMYRHLNTKVSYFISVLKTCACVCECA